MNYYAKAKDCLKRAKTIAQLQAIEEGFQIWFEQGKLTKTQFSRLDLMWCDTWVKLDLGGH